MDNVTKYLIVSTILNIIITIISVKLTPRLWKNENGKFIWILIFFIPLMSVIPVLNLIFYWCVIEEITKVLKLKKTSAKEELKSKVADLEKFARDFGSYNWNSCVPNQNNIYAKYYNCKYALDKLQYDRYSIIHDAHNKKCEDLFFKTMALIKDCYDNKTIELCKEDILKALESLHMTLQSELEIYESEYLQQQNSTKEIYNSRFSKLNEELQNAKNYSDIYKKS